MKIKPLSLNENERSFAVVLEPGEEATACLLKFARAQDVGAAQISAIGAFSRVVLGFFEFERRDYRRASELNRLSRTGKQITRKDYNSRSLADLYKELGLDYPTGSLATISKN